MKYRSLLLVMVILLSSCSILSPVQPPVESSFMIDSLPRVSRFNYPRAGNLMVLVPEAVPAYNTTKMAYVIRPYQINYFSKHRWIATPSQMLQPLLVQTLQNTHYFNAIVTPPFTGRYHYTLSTQIIELEQNFLTRPSRVKLTLRVQLNNLRNNQVIATKTISISEPVFKYSPYASVKATNRAVARALKEISQFCIRR